MDKALHDDRIVRPFVPHSTACTCVQSIARVPRTIYSTTQVTTHDLSELLHARQKRTFLATGDAVSLQPGDGFARLRQGASQGVRLVRGEPLR
jgi:hypothetical protein